LFSDKYKTHKYSVGGAYSCWMLNCWCITWSVGFKRLKEHYGYSNLFVLKTEQLYCFVWIWCQTAIITPFSHIRNWDSIFYWISLKYSCRSHWPLGLGVGLWALTCWDCCFESHREHGYLSVVSVVRCQVEVSTTSWSLVQSSPTVCSASLCVNSKFRKWGGPGILATDAPKKIK
jgi:hypothetical protein